MIKNHKASPTHREIWAAHGWKRDYEKYLPISRFIFRPIAFLLTWVAIRAGLTTEAVSWFSGFVGIAACICLVSGNADLLPFGLALLIFFNLLDCVDGSIARTMKTENPYGRFLDSICGGIVDLAFWAIIGIMVYRHPSYVYWSDPFGAGNLFWLAVGTSTCFLFILLGYLEQTFDRLIRPDWENIQTHNINSDQQAMNKISHPQELNAQQMYDKAVIFRKINNNFRVRETNYFFLLLAFYFKIIDLFLAVYFFYYLFQAATLMKIYCVRGARVRDILRKTPGP